jgi:glutamate-1-semialdehyde aminotransferase
VKTGKSIVDFYALNGSVYRNTTMNENTENTVATLTPMVRVKAGKGFKQVQNFGQGSARSLKEAFKAQNPKLSGKALSKMVNETLRGEKSLREQLGAAFLQSCYQNGMILDRGEITKGGAKLVLVNVAPKVEAVSVETDYENMSPDEINALLHRLEGLLDSKVAAIEG